MTLCMCYVSISDLNYRLVTGMESRQIQNPDFRAVLTTKLRNLNGLLVLSVRCQSQSRVKTLSLSEIYDLKLNAELEKTFPVEQIHQH